MYRWKTPETSLTEELDLISLAPPTSTTQAQLITPANVSPAEGSPEETADAIALPIPVDSPIDEYGPLVVNPARSSQGKRPTPEASRIDSPSRRGTTEGPAEASFSMNLDPVGPQDPTHDPGSSARPPEDVHAPDTDEIDPFFWTGIGKRQVLFGRSFSARLLSLLPGPLVCG